MTDMRDALEACRDCGADCRVEVFDTEMLAATLWICSNHPRFGGDCPSTDAYLTEAAWNTRASTQTDVERLVDAARDIFDDIKLEENAARELEVVGDIGPIKLLTLLEALAAFEGSSHGK